MIRMISFLVFTGAAAAPALSMSSIPIPEPGEVGLFLLGVIGLMIGRRASRRG
ncbi:hypothetical protein BH09PSE3_BH09PSE3_13530 [soil metagenome]